MALAHRFLPRVETILRLARRDAKGRVAAKVQPEMKHDKPLVDRDYVLDKFPGKGGWTFTLIPEIAPDPHSPFGWVRVRGTIDGVEIRDHHLMPGDHGSKQLFLSVKADIRKKIGKQAGDTIHVVLWLDNDPLEVPEDLRLCLADDAAAAQFFNSLGESQRRAYIRRIDSSKTPETRIQRLAKTINALAEQRKFADT
jgi:HAMP domain-containing protein